MTFEALSDEQAQEAVDALGQCGSQRKAAQFLGIARSTYQERLKRAAERGMMLDHPPAMPGFRIAQVTDGPNGRSIQQKPERGDQFAVPSGHLVKGVSALVDEDGRQIVKWIKTRAGANDVDIVETLKNAFKDYRAAEPIPAPSVSSDNLLTLIPCNDWHVNLLTWERETGQNWDLKIAERVIGGAIDDAIDRSPPSSVGIVLGGGDLMHADDNTNRTALSGNVLEADGRHQKGIEVAQRLKVRTIDAALRKHNRVIVRVLKGNHDEYSSVAIAYFLLAWYRNEPRVTVDVDASLFFWHRFGKVFLGATHGHTVKLDKMASIMAHRRAEDWGATKFRYIHGFHVHHHSKLATEGGGVISESHQAPIPQDAWHYGAGFLSGRSVKTITYHREFGEISRSTVAILDAA